MISVIKIDLIFFGAIDLMLITGIRNESLIVHQKLEFEVAEIISKLLKKYLSFKRLYKIKLSFLKM